MAGYDTGVTPRQLFYRLVADQTLPNTHGAYKTLSDRTAKARRSGTFPDLIDYVRGIELSSSFTGPDAARRWLHDVYRRDRTEGQAVSVYLGVEKRGIVAQLSDWYGHLGIPILSLGGYSSQSYVDRVKADVSARGRPAVLLYVGDHDASGEDIDRDFVERSGCFTAVMRIALNAEQVVTYNLPPAPGKERDSRAAGFVAKHGSLVQVELDALPPDLLRSLFDAALAAWWDHEAVVEVIAREEEERALLSPS